MNNLATEIVPPDVRIHKLELELKALRRENHQLRIFVKREVERMRGYTDAATDEWKETAKGQFDNLQRLEDTLFQRLEDNYRVDIKATNERARVCHESARQCEAAVEALRENGLL